MTFIAPADMFRLTTAFNHSRFSEEVCSRPRLAIFTPAVQSDFLFEFRRPALEWSISRHLTMPCASLQYCSRRLRRDVLKMASFRSTHRRLAKTETCISRALTSSFIWKNLAVDVRKFRQVELGFADVIFQEMTRIFLAVITRSR
jgi:hypothetical protein